MSHSDPSDTRTKRLMKIWKVFAFYESRLSIEFISDLTRLSEAQVVFILESHRDTYDKIVAGQMKNFNNRMKHAL
jgi:hypothetical protein